MLRMVVTLMLLLLGVAVAQEVALPAPDLDPRTWFDNPLALAGVVLAVTGFVRKQFNTHGLVTLVVSFASGVGIAVAASFNMPYLGQLFTGTFGEALVLGATAAVIASGGWDVVKGLLLEAVANLGKRS